MQTSCHPSPRSHGSSWHAAFADVLPLPATDGVPEREIAIVDGLLSVTHRAWRFALARPLASGCCAPGALQ